MKNKELATRVKNLRSQMGLSQEELAENSELSLRTIQRIENGETEPRGDTLRRLSVSFNVSPEEIVDWTVQEDNGFLIGMNLSALSFIFFPLLGILVPLIIWISKKDKIKNLNKLAKKLLNFQITWVIFFFIGFITIIASTTIRLNNAGYISPSIITPGIFSHLIFVVVMYAFNIISIVINSFQLKNNNAIRYIPQIPFLR